MGNTPNKRLQPTRLRRLNRKNYLMNEIKICVEHNTPKRFIEKCWLRKHPEFHGCCCQCRFRLRAFAQATSTAMQNSWICIAFAEGADVAFVGNFQHGLCEL